MKLNFIKEAPVVHLRLEATPEARDFRSQATTRTRAVQEAFSATRFLDFISLFEKTFIFYSFFML